MAVMLASASNLEYTQLVGQTGMNLSSTYAIGAALRNTGVKDRGCSQQELSTNVAHMIAFVGRIIQAIEASAKDLRALALETRVNF
jgi:hypothetical protein